MKKRTLLELLLVVAILAVAGLLVKRVLDYRAFQAAIEKVEGFHEPNQRDVLAATPGRPHDLASYVKDPTSLGRYIPYRYSTNAHGQRGGPVAQPKPPGTYRVAVAAECVGYGPGVADDEIYPALLERKLRQAFPERAIDVVNGSNIGGTAQGLARQLEQELLAFEPDMVVYAPGANTVFLPSHVGPPLRMTLQEDEYKREMKQLRDSLTRVLALSRRHGFSLVLVTPTCNSFFFPDGQRWADELLRFARTNRLAALDTTSLIRQAEARDGLSLERDVARQRLVSTWGGEREILLDVPFDGAGNTMHVAPEIYQYLEQHHDMVQRYSFDDNHPSAAGHELIAEGLLATIREQGLR